MLLGLLCLLFSPQEDDPFGPDDFTPISDSAAELAEYECGDCDYD